MIKYILHSFKNVLNFSGRASRKEFLSLSSLYFLPFLIFLAFFVLAAVSEIMPQLKNHQYDSSPEYCDYCEANELQERRRFQSTTKPAENNLQEILQKNEVSNAKKELTASDLSAFIAIISIMLIFLILFFFGILSMLSLAVRRLNDIEKTQSMFLMLLPAIGMPIIFLICLKKDNPDENKYGPPPVY